MARARILKPGFFTNEVLAELPFEARLLFAGLWTLADREGRLEDRPKRIKAALFPWDDVPVDELLFRLAAKGFILRYFAEQKEVLQIVTFTDHQHPHVREVSAGWPSPEKAVLKHNPFSAEAPPRLPVPDPVSDPVSEDPEKAPRQALDDSPVLLVFPTIGAQKEWALRQSQLFRWVEQYEGLDVFQEARKAWSWVDAKPGRRKTAGGMKAFLVNWFNRAADSGRARLNGSSGHAPAHGRVDSGSTCPHSPRCGSTTACVERTIRESRETRGQAQDIAAIKAGA